MKKRGRLIVIEGTDGSGKSTLWEQLGIRLKTQVPVFMTSFPRYETKEGITIRKYLDGYFGEALEIPPRIASHLYAEDRRKARNKIRSNIEAGNIVLSARYIGSNLAHQGAKFFLETETEKIEKSLREMQEFRDYIQWAEHYEFNDLGIILPDLTFCLNVPIEITQRAIETQGREKDGHEINTRYQELVRQCYLWIAENKPNWRLIECVDDKRRKSVDKLVEEISSQIL